MAPTTLTVAEIRSAVNRYGKAAGKRLLDPRAGSPPLSFVLDLATRLPAVGMKTAPEPVHDL